MVKEAGSFAEFAKHYDLDVPEALELELMKEHIKSLLHGKTVYLPKYDMSGTAIRKDNVTKTLSELSNTNPKAFVEALENVEGDFSPLYTALKGNTAVMFSQVANAPARLIKEFTKDTKGEGKPQLKAAYVQESFYDASSLEALVNIKSKNELIADVIALLESPAKNVISALQSSGQTIHGLLKTLEER